MIYLWLFIVALAIALVFVFAVFYWSKRSNELTKKKCGNCDIYDNPMYTCWLRCERRMPGDDGCDFFYLKDRDDTESSQSPSDSQSQPSTGQA
jgi:hypothetical protein